MTFSRPVSVLQGVLLTKELRQDRDCSLRPEYSIDFSGQCGLHTLDDKYATFLEIHPHITIF